MIACDMNQMIMCYFHSCDHILSWVAICSSSYRKLLAFDAKMSFHHHSIMMADNRSLLKNSKLLQLELNLGTLKL
jgi:hypothetical protein